MIKKEIKQVIERASQETAININYEDRTIDIYSNRATVINRIIKRGHEPYKVEHFEGEICGAFFKIPSKEASKFLIGSIFKF